MRTRVTSQRCRMSGMMRSTARHMTADRSFFSSSYSGLPRSRSGSKGKAKFQWRSRSY